MLKYVLRKWIFMIKLNDIIDALEFVNIGMETYAYYNPKENKIFYIDEYNTFDDNEDLIEESISLPSKFYIDEYSMMEEFIETVEDIKLYNQLCIAINGAGAFRRFKDTCINFDIIDDWYKYRDEKYRELAINWCEENNIEYEE